MTSRKPAPPLPPTPHPTATKPPLVLNAIFIKKGEFLLGKNFDPTVAGQAIDGEFSLKDGGEIEQRHFLPDDRSKSLHFCRFVLHFQFTYKLKAEEGTSAPINNDEFAAKVSAEIAVDYLFLGTGEPEIELFDAWGKSNALMHVWPYWREFCHSALTRMNLPVVLLPLLNITQKTKQE